MKKTKQQDCFPGAEGSIELIEGIKLQELRNELQNEYDTWIDFVQTKFKNDTAKLMANRAKLGNIKQEIDATIGGKSNSGEQEVIITVSHARKIAKRLKVIIGKSVTPRIHRKKNIVDPVVGTKLNQSLESMLSKFNAKIAQLLPEDLFAKTVKTKIGTSHDKVVKKYVSSTAIVSSSANGSVSNTKSSNNGSNIAYYNETVENSEIIDDIDYTDSANIELPLSKEIWGKAFSDPIIMVEMLKKLEEAAGSSEHAVLGYLPKDTPISSYLSLRRAREQYIFAANAIAEYRESGTVSSKPPRENSRTGWSLLFKALKKEVIEEVESGNTAFHINDVDVAFECELSDLKLKKQYDDINRQKLEDFDQTSKFKPLKLKKKTRQYKDSGNKIVEVEEESDNNEDEEDFIAIDIEVADKGFSDKEIKNISPRDRMAINALFDQISFDERPTGGVELIELEDAIIIREVIRKLLQIQDDLGTHFRTRLNMTPRHVFKMLQHHELGLLTTGEQNVLSVLHSKFNAIADLQESDYEKYDESKSELMILMVVYRRLLRLKNFSTVKRDSERIAEVFEVQPAEVKKWEHKTWIGMTNEELAPELFKNNTANDEFLDGENLEKEELDEEYINALPTKRGKGRKGKKIKIKSDYIFPEPEVKIPDNELWLKYQDNHDILTRNKLVERYINTVYQIAKKLAYSLPNSVEIDDLMSAGVFGLMEAIDAFDLSRSIKFETYCPMRIRGAMLDYLRGMDFVPRLVRSRASKRKQAIRALRIKLGRDPEHHEVANRMGISIEDYFTLLNNIKRGQMSSIHQSRHETDSEKIIEAVHLVEDYSVDNPRDLYNINEFWSGAVEGLNEIESKIVLMYYRDGKTMKEIAIEVDLSESRVSQMHSALIQKIQIASAFKDEVDHIAFPLYSMSHSKI